MYDSSFFPRTAFIHARIGQQLIWCAAFWLCLLWGATPPAARAVPAYETITVAFPVVPADSIAYGNNMNDDGAVPLAWFDESRSAWAVGAWLPRPLYGKPAGWSEHYTVPISGRGSDIPIWPFIDQAGVVTYVGTGFPGSAEGINVNGSPVNIPWTRDCTNGFLCGRSRGPSAYLAAPSSAAAPFAHWYARQAERNTIFEPYRLVYAAAGALDNGLQTLGMPGGYDFALVAFATHTGHRVWTGYNEVGDPLQGTASLESFDYVESPAGSFEITGRLNWITGRGDVAYSTAESGQFVASLVRLAGPLGPLGPGTYAQASLPGMPADHRIAAMNSAGVILAARQSPHLIRYRVVAGGKSAALSSLTTLPEPANGSYGTPGLNETGMLIISPQHTVAGRIVYLGTHLLIPTLDCDVALSGTQPYRIGEEFDLDVTVRNVAGAVVTNVRVEGDTPGSSGLSVSSWPEFDILSGPSPATPFTLAPGGEQVIRYRCRAKRSGVGEVTAKVKATAASGNPLRGEHATPLEIEVRGDLLVKLAEEPSTAFALDNVYQRTAPLGAQDRKVEIVSEGQSRVFEVKVQNDEPQALTLRVSSLETGNTAIPARYFFGTNDITDSIKTAAWNTPELAAGASVALRVEFGPTEGAVGGETRVARLTLAPLDSSAPCDMVRMEVVNAPPVEVTLRKGSTTGLTSQSIQAGKGHADAPLIFKEDPSALRLETAVPRGLVADGVTPLLFEMKVPPENLQGLPNGIEYQMELQTVSGGTLGGAAVDSRLRVLQDGRWRTGARVLTFTATQNVHYAFLMPVASDDLQFTTGSTELKLRLRFTQPQTGAVVTDKTLLLRKPPIVLVHGYNTGGDWGVDFVRTLKTTRAGDFIRVIRYGQAPGGAPATARLNTVLPFSQLTDMLDVEIRRELIEIAVDGWAFTRIDYIGHSQGGVLGRMLCSQNGNQFLPLPFRNVENHYRGRFHRVVTVGSPHNGTRIVRYMLELQGRLHQNPVSPQFYLGIPSAVAGLLVLTGTAQDKFDPLGPSIRLLHSPDPTAPWYPDPEAKFHLVQTTVNSGLPPSIASFSPADAALGLLVNGADVLPRGSDGVVDFDSMTATTPEAGQDPPANSFQMPGSRQIAHALVITGGVNIFAGNEGQVDSLAVAEHVIAALDQKNSLLPQDRVFGPFRLAIPLPLSVSNQIRSAAGRVTGGVLDAIRSTTGPGLQAAAGPVVPGGPGFSFQFHPPAGETLAGPVQWSVERYGEDGITTAGLTLQPVPGNPARINVLMDPSAWGDVVLYGTARTLSGQVFIAAPKVIWSVEPDVGTYSLSDIVISPADGEYPAGATIEPQLWETYYPNEGGNEFQLQRWITPETLQVVSFDPSVVDVSNPLLWRLNAIGRADVSVTWKELSTTAGFVVYSQASNSVDDDGDGLANADEADVPNRNGGPLRGDGNGDSGLDRQQNQVASLRSPSGQWLTLQASARGLNGVAIAPAPSDPGALPGNYAFDHGFLTFGQYLVTSGASMNFTLYLPTNSGITTVWAYGATPGDSNPHWYEFLYDGKTGAEIQNDRVLLHLTDGGRGDGDGDANLYISGVKIGLARLVPAPPTLRISLDSPGQHTVAWPIAFPNAARTYLESANAPSPSTQWQFVPVAPTQVGGENKLIHTNAGPGQFYRLRGQ